MELRLQFRHCINEQGHDLAFVSKDVAKAAVEELTVAFGCHVQFNCDSEHVDGTHTIQVARCTIEQAAIYTAYLHGWLRGRKVKS